MEGTKGFGVVDSSRNAPPVRPLSPLSLRRVTLHLRPNGCGRVEMHREQAHCCRVVLSGAKLSCWLNQFVASRHGDGTDWLDAGVVSSGGLVCLALERLVGHTQVLR